MPLIKAALCAAVGPPAAAPPKVGGASFARKPAAPRMLVVVENAEDALEEQPQQHADAYTAKAALHAILRVRTASG